MTLRDKFIIVLIMIMVVLSGVLLKSNADKTVFSGIFCGDSDYSIAAYAKDDKTRSTFINETYNPDWKNANLYIQNVSNTEGDGKATISFSTAACVNEGQAPDVNEDYTEQKDDSASYNIVNVIDVRWDNDNKKYTISVDGKEMVGYSDLRCFIWICNL